MVPDPSVVAEGLLSSQDGCLQLWLSAPPPLLFGWLDWLGLMLMLAVVLGDSGILETGPGAGVLATTVDRRCRASGR